MSDLISRQAAIDAMNGLPKWSDDLFSAVCLDYSDVISVLSDTEKLPSAEPEIIRCKDCKYAHLTYSGDCKFCDKWTDEFGIPEEVYLDGAFFCGYAKRREDE